MTYDQYVPLGSKHLKEFFKPVVVAGRKIIERDWRDRAHIKGNRLFARSGSFTATPEELPGFVEALLAAYPFSRFHIVYEPVRELTKEEREGLKAFRKAETEREEAAERRRIAEYQREMEALAKRRIAAETPAAVTLVDSAILILEKEGYTVTK